jgi:hypothetical protein
VCLMHCCFQPCWLPHSGPHPCSEHTGTASHPAHINPAPLLPFRAHYLPPQRPLFSAPSHTHPHTRPPPPPPLHRPHPHTPSGAERSFVTFCLEPLYKITSAVIAEHPKRSEALLATHFGVTLKSSSWQQDVKPLLKEVCVWGEGDWACAGRAGGGGGGPGRR